MSMFFSDVVQRCDRNHVGVAMMLIVKLSTVRILNQHLCNYQIISSGLCGVGDSGWAPSPTLLQNLFLYWVSSSPKAEGAICSPFGVCFGRSALIARGFVRVLLLGTSSMPWNDELPRPVLPIPLDFALFKQSSLLGSLEFATTPCSFSAVCPPLGQW